ncbi:hypothetical protein EYC84_001020 [Monilinia fructicola]|uniref:Uncharacterized protein n=1 Tax=Monilinia fructicola TaxID=38448 RepID=A0A5M9JNK5_MONFR|nr:hypothetical protein EYC84_001020 [Monilinia fructicola]
MPKHSLYAHYSSAPHHRMLIIIIFMRSPFLNARESHKRKQVSQCTFIIEMQPLRHPSQDLRRRSPESISSTSPPLLVYAFQSSQVCLTTCGIIPLSSLPSATKSGLSKMLTNNPALTCVLVWQCNGQTPGLSASNSITR